MNLYCWAHNTAHPFTPDDVEEIVYALTGVFADAECGNWSSRIRRMRCPKEVLGWARDGEMYYEHVEQGVECRKAIA